MLVGAVVIHHPDFFRAGAGADESDLRGSDSGSYRGKAADNFVGELVSELADLRVGRRAAIDLSYDGLRGRAAHVVEPAGNSDFAGGFGEIAKGHEVRVDLRCGPVEIAEFGAYGGHLCGIETGADEIDDNAELQVVAKHLGEELRVRLGGVGARREIR